MSTHSRRRMARRSALVIAALAAFAIGMAQSGADNTTTPAAAPATDAWRSFSGSWYATGTRQTVATEGKRPAVVVCVEGSVVVENGHDLSRGFRGEAVYYHDGLEFGVGRAVWIDENGDRIFSELRGDPAQTGRRIAGKVVAGTGRYAKLQGDYTMSWQFVIEAEEGTIQGRAADLRGKFRFSDSPR